MTGKEALSKLDRNIYLNEGENLYALDLIHIIEKELKVLETIRKIIIESAGWNDIDTLNKIYEELENEK